MEEIDIKYMMKLLWKNKVLIIIFMVVGTIVGYVYNAKFTVPKYKSTTKVICSSSTRQRFRDDK